MTIDPSNTRLNVSPCRGYSGYQHLHLSSVQTLLHTLKLPNRWFLGEGGGWFQYVMLQWKMVLSAIFSRRAIALPLRSHITSLKPQRNWDYIYCTCSISAHIREFQNWANQHHHIMKPLKNIKKTSLLHPFTSGNHLDQKHHTWTSVLPQHTTWEFQQQQTSFNSLHVILHCYQSNMYSWQF